jgi:spermidine synthase
MDGEKYKLKPGIGANADFHSLEKRGPQTSNDWKSARYSSWFAALIAAFCIAAFAIVAKCLLRQGAEIFPVAAAAGAMAAGAAAGIALLFVPRIWNPSLALWLAAAGTMASAWGFKALPPDQLQFAVLPFAFFAGALLASCIARHTASALFAAVGAAAAIYSAGVWLPAAGYTAAIYVIAAVLAMAFLIIAVILRARAVALLAGLAIFAVAGFFAPLNLSRVTIPEGWKLSGHRDGIEHAVMLIEKQTAPGQPILQRLILDNRYIIGGQLGFGEKRLGHVPLLLKPDARSVLFLNVNAGVSMGAAQTYVGLEKIDCVEPVPEIAAFLPQFAASNDRIAQEPRAKFFRDDPAHYLAASNATYDVIIANPTPPMREDAAQLFTAEFYRDAKKRLAPGGVFMQWLPLFELDEASLKAIVRTFAASFPDAQGFIGIYNGELPVVGLFTRATPDLPAVADIQKTLRPNAAAQSYVAEVRDLLASRFFDHASLVTFAGEGPTGTGAQPAVHFSRADRLRPQDAKRGGELLAMMLATTATNAPVESLVKLPDDAESLRKQVAMRTETMRHYLAGDILRSSDDTVKLREMAYEFLRAYDNEPDLPLPHAMLLALTVQKPGVAILIYQGLLKHNPNDKQAKAMICTIQEKNAQMVGVPLPPSACGPGTIPAAPAPLGKKPPSFPAFPTFTSRKPPNFGAATNQPAAQSPAAPPSVTF